MILVIDDVKTFPFPDNVEVVYARTLEQGFSGLYEYSDSLDQLWLDHDLGIDKDGNEEDIRPLVLWIAENAFYSHPKKIGRIVICSLNPVGIDWIFSTLSPYYDVVICNDPEAVFDLLGSNQVKWY